MVEVDVRTTGPTPPAFEAAIAAGGDGLVLLIDTFEQGQALEGWLRTGLLPRLPYDALVVVAGRLPPDPAWRADPAWHKALRVIHLPVLGHGEADALLANRGVPAAARPELIAFAGGHPLALALAAEVGSRGPGGAQPGHTVVEVLLDSLVGDVPSAEHRRALEVCAHVEVTTEELLRSAVGERAAELFSWLRGLPFVETGPHGVYPHDIVRDALNQDLRWRDPEGFASLHIAVRDHLVGRIRVAAEPDVAEATRSLMFLYRGEGRIADYITWQGRGEVYEDGYRPGDRETVLAMVSEHEGPESAAIAAFWLDRQPGGCHVHRHAESGAVVGFSAWLRLTGPTPDEIAADPVAAKVWRHAEAHGSVRDGEHIAVSRFNIDPAAYARTSPVVDHFVTRVMAEWVRAERLAWSFVSITDPEFWAAQMRVVEHERLQPDLVIDGLVTALHCHDWRVAPLEPWLRRHDEEVLTGRRPARHEPAPRAVLSRPDFDAAVRAALRDQGREDLLDANPLCASRLTSDGKSLRALLAEAVAALADDRRGAKRHDAVHTTYFLRMPNQEAAAQRLGLPFSTYRRHLTAGVALVCERLWDRELSSEWAGK
ncbi:ATP-binding protein [Streptomyces sp. NPDC088847]|uniref:ATP-binding protein n=1 Tax=Streptomyces sp. NPDC088847 TaxID=3365909 RepID=UPI00382E9951